MAQVVNAGHSDFNELVFDHRNKSYGAYELRKRYANTVLIALLIGIAFISLVIAIPYISAWIKSMNPAPVEDMTKVTEFTLAPPPPLDENAPPPPPPPPDFEAPKQESVKFTVPVVTTEDVVEEITTTEDLTVSNPGSVTQEGEEGFTSLPGDGDGNDVIGETNTNQIFTIVEKMPEFPGGEKAMLEYLSKNIKYPQSAKELGIQGTVYVSFIVDTYGNISKVEILRGIGGGCDEEAVRVVKNMPRWTPGKQGGRPVPVQFRLPIKFSLR